MSLRVGAISLCDWPIMILILGSTCVRRRTNLFWMQALTRAFRRCECDLGSVCVLLPCCSRVSWFIRPLCQLKMPTNWMLVIVGGWSFFCSAVQRVACISSLKNLSTNQSYLCENWRVRAKLHRSEFDSSSCEIIVITETMEMRQINLFK